jgi:elongation factor G
LLAAALRELEVDDPTLRVEFDRDRLVVRGMGELHLDIVADLVRDRTDAPFRRSRPQVDRRETVHGSGTGEAEVRALVGGRELAAYCRLAIEPLAAADLPAEVVDTAQAGAAVVEELRSRLRTGARVGPLFGARVSVLEVRAGEAAGEALRQQAAAKALAAALASAELVELEPWVALELWCPEEAANAVLADLGARGATVSGVASGRLGARLQGRAPLARMLGYVTKLRSMTRGMGQVSLQPGGFAPIRGARESGPTPR